MLLPPSMAEHLLGFDARELYLDVPIKWPRERRRQFLLRPDVERPLSVDPLVWPSLFGDGLTDDEVRAVRLVRSHPSYKGANDCLWDRLDDLLAEVQGDGLHRYAVIAVSWVSDTDPAYGDLGSLQLGLATPGDVSPAWKPLGLDVADDSLISAVTDCAYAQHEVEEATRRWGQKLNSHHLFTSPEEALSFASFSNARVPEHAPFFVFALYAISGGDALCP